MRRKEPLLFVATVFILVSLSCSNPISDYFSTQTAILQTATATMWTPTPTNTPTDTPTDTPTNTPTLTPTPEYLYMDDFDDPASGWNESSDSFAQLEYFDGGYRMKLKQASYFIWSISPLKKSFSDFRLEVDVKKIGGPDNGEFGVIARYHDRLNFYAFLVSNDGEGIIFKYEDGDYEGLSSDRLEDIQGVHPDALNHLAVLCRGEELELYVNGELVLSATDTSFRDGDLGLLVGNLDIAGADFLFDNFYLFPA
jgi:hypothetical protein